MSRSVNTSWRGYTRRDATEPLTIRIARADVSKSVARDPDACIVARAAVRRKDIVEASIGAKLAYVVFKAQPKIAYRYEVSSKDAARIHDFDESPASVKLAEKWLVGTTVTLKPVPPTHRIGAMTQPRTRTDSTRDRGVTSRLSRKQRAARTRARALRHLGGTPNTA